MKPVLELIRNSWREANKSEAVIYVAAPLALAAASAISDHLDGVLPFLVACGIGLRWLIDQTDVKVARTIHKLTGDFDHIRVERNDAAFPHRIHIRAGEPKPKRLP